MADTKLSAVVVEATTIAATDRFYIVTGIGGAPASKYIEGQNINVLAAKVPLVDAGALITATEVEGALQENRALIDTNSTHVAGDGTDHADVATNTTHITSTGADHTWLDQDVTIGTSPDFHYYETDFIPAAAFMPATTNPAAAGSNEYGTNDQDFDHYAFDGGATEERIMLPLSMPDEWDRGAIKVKLYWSSASGSTSGDTCEWGVKGVAISDSDPLDVAQGTPQVISDALTADNGTDLQICLTPSITIGGSPAVDDLINLEVYRNTDGTDDMAEDAWLKGIKIQYQTTLVPAVWS